MKFSDLKIRAEKHFPESSYSDLKDVRWLRINWMLAVRKLGDRWILAKPVGRL